MSIARCILVLLCALTMSVTTQAVTLYYAEQGAPAGIASALTTIDASAGVDLEVRAIPGPEEQVQSYDLFMFQEPGDMVITNAVSDPGNLFQFFGPGDGFLEPDYFLDFAFADYPTTEFIVGSFTLNGTTGVLADENPAPVIPGNFTVFGSAFWIALPLTVYPVVVTPVPVTLVLLSLGVVPMLRRRG